jgi:hypothetical protein
MAAYFNFQPTVTACGAIAACSGTFFIHPLEFSLESVREGQAGLQSFRSMRRIEARRKNASALRLRFFHFLASLRQRLRQTMVLQRDPPAGKFGVLRAVDGLLSRTASR